MSQRCNSIALTALLLWLAAAPQCGSGIRWYKSREDVFKMIGAKNETKIFFTDCEQSSQTSSCAFAIDTSYVQTPSQCALTNLEFEPWWIGLLETPAYITTVTLLNMNNSQRVFPDALTSISVSGNGEICFNGMNDEAFIRRTYPCFLISEQVVIMSNVHRSVMALCDVEVQGAPLKFAAIRSEDDVLPVSMCRQTSSVKDERCEMALDKDSNVCTETKEHVDPSIEFLLEKPSVVTKVVLYGQPKGYGRYTKRFSVRVGTRACRSVFDSEVTADGTLTIECGIFGNEIMLTTEINGKEAHKLKVCEVRIFGYPMEFEELDKYSYKGCYGENTEDRDLPTWVSSTSMSVKKCYRMCKRKGLQYFAMQKGKHCYCGSTYGKHGKVPGESCNLACQGNVDEICGGKSANSVYQVTPPTEAASPDNAGATAEAEGGAST